MDLQRTNDSQPGATLAAITSKVQRGEAISRADAHALFTTASAEDLRRLATMVRDGLHPPQAATYLIMAIINYTNICIARCDYCSFYRLPHQEGTYLLTFAEVAARVEQLQKLGGTLVSFNGGFHPRLRIADYAELFSRLHARFPELVFFEMTVAEFMFACKVSRLSYEEGAKILREAGTQWVTGGGAEVLDEGFRRRHSPGKYTVSDYFTAQEAILAAGIGSTATMVIGFDETLDERLNHLEALRSFQERLDRPLPSFLCWTYKPWNNALGGDEISCEAYLRWLAVCRIYLHNFKHIRTSVLTQNEGALAGLQYGANDFDLPTEDEVTEKAGATISLQFDAILATARASGYNPIHRSPFASPKASPLNI